MPTVRHYAEEQQAIALIQWCRTYQARYPDLELLYAVPNGGRRNAREAARLKAQGVKAGVWDYHLPVGRIFLSGPCLGLWIELKVKPNKLTVEQAKWGQRMEQAGHQTYVAYEWTEAAREIAGYLGLPPGTAP